MIAPIAYGPCGETVPIAPVSGGTVGASPRNSHVTPSALKSEPSDQRSSRTAQSGPQCSGWRFAPSVSAIQPAYSAATGHLWFVRELQ
jgi:hypothetical protein